MVSPLGYRKMKYASSILTFLRYANWFLSHLMGALMGKVAVTGKVAVMGKVPCSEQRKVLLLAAAQRA